MARITPLEPPFTADVAARLAAMMPPGQPPIGRCEYEWGVHLMVFADRAGLGRSEISSLTRGSAGDACWTAPRDRALIRVADALHDAGDVDDPSRSARTSFC
jgi:hypothetical protein